MKRYLLFAGPEYYPAGGWGDFAGSADSVEGALRLLADDKKVREMGEQQWWEIVDATTEKVVKDSSKRC